MDWSNLIKAHDQVPSDSEIAQFENDLGWSLPSQYRTFLLSVNGGKIIAPCTITTEIEGLEELVELSFLFPFKQIKGRRALGVVELYRLWDSENVGMKSALPIGDDGGTGFFFLMLGAQFYGQIYFAYKDAFWGNLEHRNINSHGIPDYMGFVCHDVETLLHKCESQM